MINLNDLRTNGGKGAELIYSNPLACQEDIRDFVLEGSAKISFPDGRMRLENAMDASQGQKANYVLWCPKNFPSDVLIEWDFWPIREPGLCILFFSASGRNGEDLFDPSLQKRTGEYPLYHHGDINAFHVSYFRRKEPDERQFHTCNLRKSYGFHLVAQGGDPIPDVEDAKGPYRLSLLKKDETVCFFVNDLEVFRFVDDGVTYGPMLGGGKIGFRQLAPLIGEYANLHVYSLVSDKEAAVKETIGQISSLIHRAQGNITLEECSAQLNYHPSYIWKILKKCNTTFTALVNQEKLKLAMTWLDQPECSVAEIAEKLHYSNSQNFIRFFSKYSGMTPGEYRKKQQ
ncbi:MAG: DUF1961 family protein [Lachnospiraceae bacterium]|nr:DUF1961 family protein [Lachnospiraceae bacterium]